MTDKRDELSLELKAAEVFGRVSKFGAISLSAGFNEDRKLSNWMNRMGFLANYRGSLEQMPILSEKENANALEYKAMNYIVEETYPGPKNGEGAIFSIEATKYAVVSVTGFDNKLLSVHMCKNEECQYPFKTYSAGTKVCPLCLVATELIEVYETGTVLSKAKRYANFVTFPVTNSRVSQDPKTSATLELKALGFDPLRVKYGRVVVTYFTAAFYKQRRGQVARRLHPSQGQIQRSPVAFDQKDIVNQFLKMEKEQYAPLGFAMNTLGLTIMIPRRVDQHGSETGALSATPFVSFAQALRRAICVIAQSELTEFSVDFDIESEYVAFNIYDTRAGGNGISQTIKEDLEGERKLFTLVASYANCDSCHDFCDRCLLLQRTPSFYLERGLLNRQELKKMVSV